MIRMRTAVVNCLHGWKTVQRDSEVTHGFRKTVVFPGQQSSRTHLCLNQAEEPQSGTAEMCMHIKYSQTQHTHDHTHTHTHTDKVVWATRLREVERSCFFANCTSRLPSPGKPDQPFSRMSQRKRSFTFGAYGGRDKHGLFCSVGGVCQLCHVGGVAS